MGDDVISRIAGYLVSIQGHHPQTFGAAPIGMGAPLRVGGEVPFQHVFGPVARRANHQVFDVPAQVSCHIARCANPLFGEVQVFVGMGGVYLRKCVDRAAIQVKGRAIDVFFGQRVVEDGDGIIGAVGVVVVNKDFGFEAIFDKSWPQVVFHKIGLLVGIHQQ